MTPAPATGRFAVYYAPAPGSALARFGARWFADVPPPAVPGIAAERLRRLTDTPRFYGFHATLRAPFALRAGATESDLAAAVEAFTATRPPAPVGALRLRRLAGFLALMPAVQDAAVGQLAQACVESFDHFRAPPDRADLATRRAAGLTPRQDALLDRWGYPYVAEQFRFHMTLTDRLDEPEADAVRRALEGDVAALARAPLVIDALTLFAQADRETPFRPLARYPLRGAES